MEHNPQQAQSQPPQPQLRSPSSSVSRTHHQFHPSRAAILDLFNLYLGLKNPGKRSDDSIREPPNKTQKRVTALNRELPPRNEQFLLDFGQLQSQFTDQEQLSAVAESVLISLVIHCSSHAPRAEFILFAICSLSSIGCINWDTFLPSLLSSVSSTEISTSQGNQPSGAVSSANLTSGLLSSSTTVASTSIFQSSNPASPLPTVHGIGSPVHSAAEPSSSAALSPMKSSDVNGISQQSIAKVNLLTRDNAASSLRQLCCKIILTGLDSNLKPVTHAEVFHHMLNWLINWDQKLHGVDEFDSAKYWKPDKVLIEWLHSCLDVIWLLVETDKCRIPFYELLRSGLQFLENIPDDEALFTLILEIHRRRDMMAMHMQMLDQHLHCPTFGTPRLLPQATANSSGEAVANMRYSPITYSSVLGEPLHGETTCLQFLNLEFKVPCCPKIGCKLGIGGKKDGLVLVLIVGFWIIEMVLQEKIPCGSWNAPLDVQDIKEEAPDVGRVPAMEEKMCEAIAISYELGETFNLVRGIALPDCFPRPRIQA
ncbi:hypothetical protein HAX54_041126 [Datura stramonium]|uniref:Mediator of RNA polymerase II transcription subunit 23 n=1 Tax=Datura stramonium TaxID=4076 RepID=A0ABS8SKY4_DATST|nr:hypothetical protein [Datura stramonium]